MIKSTLTKPTQAPLSTGTIFPSHMEGFLHPLGGPATGVYRCHDTVHMIWYLVVAHSITYLKTKNHILISFVSKPVGLLLGNVGQERSLVTGFMSLKRIGCNWLTVTFSARGKPPNHFTSILWSRSCNWGRKTEFSGKTNTDRYRFKEYLFLFVFNRF